jgi:CRISPR/Cas system-associated exonuclease Cas4 (RecB family)
MGRVRESIAEIEETIQNDEEDFPLRGIQNGHCPNCDFKTFCPGFAQFQENSGDE